MAVGFVLRWNLRNFFRLHASIAGNLHHPTQIFKANNSLSYKNNRLRRSFHNTSSLFVSGKESSSIDLSGIFPPIVTPFEDDEEVSYAKLEENFSKWNDIPFKEGYRQDYPFAWLWLDRVSKVLLLSLGEAGYVVQGSNGEYPYLRPDEKIDLVRKVRELAPKDKLIIAGSGCEATRDTIEMTKKMAEAGADAALVVTPCFYKNQMTVEALEKHFVKVAENSPIPVILYSVPANTGIDLVAQCVNKLSSHPNIVGLKDSGGDISKISYILHETAANDFQVLAGSASFLLASYHLGAVGGVCALANVLGREVCHLHEAFKQGKIEEAKLLQHKMILPNIADDDDGEGLKKWANVFKVTKNGGVPALKKSMEFFGYYGGPTRSPLLPLKDSSILELKEIFKFFDGFQD
ncbi:4-hydroxy-2-oxoglutarate aldolase [Acropora cervicornis]|uniref:4-hydroxy-2-oxoglutarate aldolase, mitochondrial n=1 Tax=Acropora cervicornis TaxID=6130 RepID=A0AAD9VFP2_ACRCE|nr:4-hydroxy-2-oxoglutarate aldolase [Acropora cervicornis]